ncbi:hypothetical protein ASA1KI_29880 [Opitutales bacterium ASA1]|uniref:cytochrome C assembly family protein n=1 Tax=Congregicoccus parvus TaxID=3081749 RepID=UPI002B2EDCEF|nr:hypothetical protein ASA1KI_29880 [Opitutales bacterium ASA1]
MDSLPDRTWLWLAAALYAIAFVTSTVSMIRGRGRAHGALLSLVVVGVLLHTFGLYQRGVAGGGCPVRNTFEVVQFVAWSITILYLVVGTSFRVSLLGYFTSGLAVVLSLVSLSVSRWDATVGPPVFGGVPWIEVHASFGLFAYGAFGTLALTSLMFLLQTFSLKAKRLRGLFAFLPSIVALEQIGFRLLVTGIAVLTLSILVGGHYYRQEPDSITAVKLAFATGVWAAYMVALVLRLRRTLVGASLAWTCLALFGVALVSLGPISRRPETSLDAIDAQAAHRILEERRIA